MLHRFYLLVKGRDLGSVLCPHCELTITSLFQNEILLLDVLQLFALRLLLELSHLTTIVLDLAFLMLQHLDLIKSCLQLLIQRVDMPDITAARGQPFLTLLELFLQHLLLMLQCFHVFKSLVLSAK